MVLQTRAFVHKVVHSMKLLSKLSMVPRSLKGWKHIPCYTTWSGYPVSRPWTLQLLSFITEGCCITTFLAFSALHAAEQLGYVFTRRTLSSTTTSCVWKKLTLPLICISALTLGHFITTASGTSALLYTKPKTTKILCFCTHAELGKLTQLVPPPDCGWNIAQISLLSAKKHCTTLSDSSLSWR